MRPQYNTEELIKTIKRICAVPTSQLTYTDEDWAAIATDILQTKVVPLIMSCREDYFVTYEDVASPADGVIPFPRDATGAKLRNVCYVSQTSPLILINLPKVDLDVVAGVGFYNLATLAGFYVQGNDIVLYPNTSVPTNTTIRLYYYKRVLNIAEPTKYGRVTSVDANTNTIVMDFVPYDWAAGTEINSVGSEPNFSTTNSLMTISAVSSPSIIVDDVTGVSVGDYISDIGYSAIPQIPVEGMYYLAQLVAGKALEGLADGEGAKRAYEVAEDLKTAFMITTSQRVDGSVKKVINPSGGLRVQSGTWRRGWGW